MKVLIGVSCGRDINTNRLFVNQDYLKALRAFGAFPLILDMDFISKEELSLLDGVLLTGGGDVDPLFFKEEPLYNLGFIDPIRDNFEIKLTRACLYLKIPLLGICRGMQIINIAAGGDIYQDIYTQKKDSFDHQQKSERGFSSHSVEIVEGTLLEDILGAREIRVNSFHHQAVKNIGLNFKVSANSKDNLAEALEGKEDNFVLGVQWHPEAMWKDDIFSQKIFQAFIKSCKKIPVRRLAIDSN